MTDGFYSSHSSTYFYGKRGKLTTNIFKNKKQIFRKDEFVTLLGKAVYQTENGQRLGIEIISDNLNNDIISHNFIEIIENTNDKYVSETEYFQKQTDILNNFLACNNVIDFEQLKKLINQYNIQIKILEQHIIVTPQTKLEELSPSNLIKNLLTRMGLDESITLEELSKLDPLKFKNVGLSVKNKQMLEQYLKLVGLTFKTIEKVRKKRAKRYPNN